MIHDSYRSDQFEPPTPLCVRVSMNSYRVWGPIGTGLETKAYGYNAVQEVSLHRVYPATSL